jgi:hypothetical protein
MTTYGELDNNIAAIVLFGNISADFDDQFNLVPENMKTIKAPIKTDVVDKNFKTRTD